MLAAVLTLFMVFSFSGVAVLNLSSYTALENQNAVQSMRNQYEVESSVNVALWRINNTDDELDYEDGYVSVAYDSSLKELVVSIDRFDKSYEVSMDMSEDHHFNRAIAASDSIELDGNTLTVDESHKTRGFDFLPDVDLDYFTDNAVAIHSGSFKSYSDTTFAPGIHVFTGSFITLNDVTVNGTLVFTGRFVWWTGEMNITAYSDSLTSMPAAVFTHASETVHIGNAGGGDTDHINGAIYAAGRIILLEGAEITGPVIGRVVSLSDDYDFLDTEYNDYYKWTNGFGNYSDYSWPKHIGRWRVHAS